MGNALKGETSFELDGVSYSLRYTIDALVKLEDELDAGTNEIFAMFKAGSSPRTKWVRAMFWAGLQDAHPDIDIKAAGEMMPRIPGGQAKVILLVAQSIERSFPQPKSGKSRPQNPGGPKSGTGRDS
jgi:hypothetical protein